MNIKIGIVSIGFILFGCSNSYKYINLAGIYEVNHLGIHKELLLRSDSTYTYIVVGGLYPDPRKQEGFWDFKRNNLILDAKYKYKIVKRYSLNTVEKGTICFYLYDSQGNPINDYTGTVNSGGISIPINPKEDNFYCASFKKTPNNIIISDSSKTFNDFEIKLKSHAENTFHIKLFVKNEIQNDKWRIRYHNGKLGNKWFEYDKRVLE
jgi:hypothetical protein